jgi:hypothetical protein
MSYVKTVSTPCKHTSAAKTSTTADHKLSNFTVEWQVIHLKMTNQQLEELWQLGLSKTHPNRAPYEYSELATDLLDRTCRQVYYQRVSTPQAPEKYKPLPTPPKPEAWRDQVMPQNVEEEFLGMLKTYFQRPSVQKQTAILDWVKKNSYWYPPSVCCWVLGCTLSRRQDFEELKWLPPSGLPEGLAQWATNFLGTKSDTSS